MRRWFVRTLLFVLVGVAVLAIALAVNTLRLAAGQVDVDPVKDIHVDQDRAAAHLAGTVRFRTVSGDAAMNVPDEEFLGLQRYLDDTYPKLRAALTKEIVGRHSLLYTWKGSNAKAAPILLMAHQDVVPVEPGTESEWSHPPFEGVIAGGYVWGHLGDKGLVVAIMEAVEALVDRGFQPTRTVLLEFGDDEELGGLRGAKQVAATLESRGTRPALVVDEGDPITEGIVPNVAAPVATVVVGEKGFVSVQLTVDAQGGHSAVPPANTAIGILAAALYRLEGNQMPASLQGPTHEALERLAPEMPFVPRVIMSNMWLFWPLVKRQLLASPTLAAHLRTTTAATMIEGGAKENVLPTRTRAVVNFRIRPGETIDTVLEHVRITVADARVRVERRGDFWSNPSPVSPTDGPEFDTMRKAIAAVFPGTIVAPNIFVAASDARHFRRLSRNVFGFTPLRFTSNDVKRVHGSNGRVSVPGFADAVRFYQHLIRTAAGPESVAKFERRPG